MRLGWFLQLFILIGFFYIGTEINAFLHIPLPGSVIGMLLLLFFLFKGLLKLKWIENVAIFQLQHLTFLLIPLITSLFLSASTVNLLHLNVLLILIISSLICLLGTAFSVEWYEKLKRRQGK